MVIRFETVMYAALWLMAAIFGLPGAGRALAAERIDPSRGVYDHADVLSREEEEALARTIARLRTEHGIAFAILTNDDSGGHTDRFFAESFFSRSLLVPGQPRDGILLFVNVKGRGIWVSTHGAAKRRYSKETLDSMIARMAVPMKNGDFHGGGAIFLRDADDAWRDALQFRILVGVGVVALVCAVSGGLLLRFHRRSRGKAPCARRYMTPDTKTEHLGTTFVRSYTTRVARSDDSDSGSSSGGGSSFGGSGGSF